MGGKRRSEFVKKAVLFLLLVCNCSKIIDARIYIVGGENGWSPLVNMTKWAEEKTFYAGDVLEFKYPSNETEVVEAVWVTDEVGFRSCLYTLNTTIYNDGDDKIRLPYGNNYFTSGVYELCLFGMRMAVFANTPPPM